MKLQVWSIGKAHESYVAEGIEAFTRRISRYFPIEWKLFPTPKNAASLTELQIKMSEAETLLPLLPQDATVVALDEKGTSWSSPDLAAFIQKCADQGNKTLIFLIGGPYGLHDSILQRCHQRWSLSRLVFPHQLVRLILAEQLYRACTINRNEKYHHS